MQVDRFKYFDRKISVDTKLASIQNEFKKHCKYCGHTISFYAFEPNRKLCSWCGFYNYKSGFVEFKEKLEKERKRVGEI